MKIQARVNVLFPGAKRIVRALGLRVEFLQEQQVRDQARSVCRLKHGSSVIASGLGTAKVRPGLITHTKLARRRAYVAAVMEAITF